MATDVRAGGRARRESRPPDGGRVAARARARRRARDERPLRVGQDPRLPQGEGADAGARLEDRQGPDLGRGGRVAHQRLVLVGGVAHAAAPDLAARVRLRAADDGQGGVVVLGHDRGAADSRDRRLDDARGAARRGRGSAGARRPGARGAAADRRGARARRRSAGPGRATRSSSTCRAPPARRSRTPSSSSAPAGSSRRSRPR